MIPFRYHDQTIPIISTTQCDPKTTQDSSFDSRIDFRFYPFHGPHERILVGPLPSTSSQDSTPGTCLSRYVYAVHNPVSSESVHWNVQTRSWVVFYLHNIYDVFKIA